MQATHGAGRSSEPSSRVAAKTVQTSWTAFVPASVGWKRSPLCLGGQSREELVGDVAQGREDLFR